MTVTTGTMMRTTSATASSILTEFGQCLPSTPSSCSTPRTLIVDGDDLKDYEEADAEDRAHILAEFEGFLRLLPNLSSFELQDFAHAP